MDRKTGYWWSLDGKFITFTEPQIEKVYSSFLELKLEDVDPVYQGPRVAVLRHTTQPVSKGMRHSLNPRQNGTAILSARRYILVHSYRQILGKVISMLNLVFSLQIVLITLATGLFIVAAGGISNIFLHRLAENIQDAYGKAASIAEQALIANGVEAGTIQCGRPKEQKFWILFAYRDSFFSSQF
ncbi:hypothetical protein GOBAR_DD01914 [Gossypium barbadense]|nr:hypothetical protein GOBAR_DD01914 [Gossypium barbadense]